MNRWLCCRFVLPLVLLVSLACSAQVRADAGDDAFVAARDAFRRGDEKALLARKEALANHPLASYVDYWALRLHLDQLAASDLAAFQERWPGALALEKFRLDWVKQLGKRKDWPALVSEYALLEQPDREAWCYRLQARQASGEAAAMDDTRKLWLSGEELPGSCRQAVDALVAAGKLSEDDVWARIRRAMEHKRLEDARFAAAYLTEGPADKLMAELLKAPDHFVGRLKPGFAVKRPGRELAMIALARWARSDTQAAARRWESLRDRFSADERAYVYGQLGWQAAVHHQPQAVSWFKAAEDTPLSDEQLAWKARAALRAQDWKLLAVIIEGMPLEMASRPEWVYWQGRAYKALGRKLDADNRFTRLAGQVNFYGNLADEELGRLIDVPPATTLTDKEIAAAAASPGVQRALAFYRLDMRTEGAKEWSWTLRQAGDRFLLAAAAVAQREGLYDRAISAADRTRGEHDFQMRYLAPYRDKVEPAAKDLKLDEGWVYGLMRQESRFVTAARSNVGARGLMQVMPATGKWVAKKIGFTRFNVNTMSDMDTNVLLGTNYLKLVLGSLSNHPVLASAAYNAGPGRARSWRDTRPLEGAIYVETIPFSETRDYVKKVMSNAVYYAALFEKKPQSLKARLGTILPGGESPDPEMP